MDGLATAVDGGDAPGAGAAALPGWPGIALPDVPPADDGPGARRVRSDGSGSRPGGRFAPPPPAPGQVRHGRRRGGPAA